MQHVAEAARLVTTVNRGTLRGHPANPFQQAGLVEALGGLRQAVIDLAHDGDLPEMHVETEQYHAAFADRRQGAVWRGEGLRGVPGRRTACREGREGCIFVWLGAKRA